MNYRDDKTGNNWTRAKIPVEMEETIKRYISNDRRTIQGLYAPSAPVNPEIRFQVNADGELQLPQLLKDRLGISAGSELIAKETTEGIVLWPADPPLTKVYIEPTTACNYNCRTCVRNTWDEEIGSMPFSAYKRLLDDLKKVKSLRTMAFWGIGEPLMHPRIVEMISLAHGLSVKTELITNGALLKPSMARNLIEAGLDTLVVSVDGTSSDNYEDIRCGGNLDQVQDNILELQNIKWETERQNPELGLEFVVMKRNMDQLPELWPMAFALGAAFIVLTNLLPYTEDMKEEILYTQSARMDNDINRSRWQPEVLLPRMDMLPECMDPLIRLLYLTGRPKIGLKEDAANDEGHCPFIWQGSAAVSWTGDVSPCVALLHSYRCFVLDRPKEIKKAVFGNIKEERLTDIWNKDRFKAFRRRVRAFEFPPCIDCGGCNLADSNEEDCEGNPHPVCGDCLWARRVLLCP
ncbi:MAG: radical SAM protein [Deltaproteobacteria bacterium]|nr:radical SAM protein [Deltaproteobacteria bacterium]